MFFKKFKIQTLIFLLTMFIIPQSLLAYSDKIIASGETVGIRLNTDGILIVGSYEINGHNPLVEAGLKSGDIINQINNKEVHTVEEMVNTISNCNCDSLKVSYIRENKEQNTTLNLYEDNGILKTGLYVKDSVSGVGTLTFIDPNTKLFGVLGHEIADNTTGDIIDIKDGTIFDSKITSITRSSNGTPGEKNAILYSDKVEGNVLENTNKGIFGNYTSNINDSKLYNVANIDDIKMGDATILTVLDGVEVGEFSVKILSVNETKDKLKNIQFEITDKELLEKTNGIVQGMSGSPIIQGDNIIGAVTHVVVDDPHKGYGILITNMLEEAEN
ncbi:MAG: SpoIVB peptidase [Bacilli bacterium]|nr:SpoIVB peptidase [Bacilli bacterium]